MSQCDARAQHQQHDRQVDKEMRKWWQVKQQQQTQAQHMQHPWMNSMNDWDLEDPQQDADVVDTRTPHSSNGSPAAA